MIDPGFYPLASGSKGNAILLVTRHTKILIDAGISGKAIKTHLERLNIDVSEIDAILLTHEHGDHIRGLRVLAFRMGIPVLANSGTAKGVVDAFGDCPKFKIFTTGETFEFGELEIHPFSIQHDTLDPVGFTISTQDLKLGFCTDIGFVTTLVENRLQNCDYLFVEANHQPSMVHACNRPMTYKQRVLSRVGHLSNEACGELLRKVWHPRLQHAHLAHLSEECNSPDVALATVRAQLAKDQLELDLSIAYQDQPSRPIFFSQPALT